MKLPGPDHPIQIVANPRRVRVIMGSTVIADSWKALSLREAGYREVQYIPRTDADMARLTKTSRVTHCPYKGDATHYDIVGENSTLENAAWSYEAPYPAMQEIAGLLAFYPDKLVINTGG